MQSAKDGAWRAWPDSITHMITNIGNSTRLTHRNSADGCAKLAILPVSSGLTRVHARQLMLKKLKDIVMDPQRILITGSSGFYGRAVIGAIRKTWPSAEILGLDVVAPGSDPPHRFVHCDIIGPQLREHVVGFRPDTILHFAFVVNPMRDENRMHQINVGGSRSLLAAAAEVKPARLLVSSSATAYGAWPDNPVPLTESHPLRSRSEYRYADDKYQVEGLLSDYAAAHPDTAVSWTRPCIIYGPGLTNFMIPLLTVSPILTLPGGSNPQMQFVHLDDVAAATVALLAARARGPFNVAPPDWVTIKDLAKMTRRPAIPIPFAVLRAVTACWWGLRLPIFLFPSPLWYFIRYPWVVSPDRLMSEVGFQFRYSSDDVIRQLMKDAGRLKS